MPEGGRGSEPGSLIVSRSAVRIVLQCSCDAGARHMKGDASWVVGYCLSTVREVRRRSLPSIDTRCKGYYRL